MNISKVLKYGSIAALAMAGGAASAATLGNDGVAFALGNGGTSLVTLATPADAAPRSVPLSFGAMGVSLDALAYRPKTTQLYGYDDDTDSVYLIDITTGASSLVVSNPGVTSTQRLGFDFNNVIDAARIVTTEDENVVFFPNKTPPTLEPKTSLFYIAGDPNAGIDPTVEMNAYTNAVADAASTRQFVIDTELNVLATLNNNAGDLTTVGTLTLGGSEFDVGQSGGFDILSLVPGANIAYGLFTNEADGVQAIYEVDLTSGVLSFVESAPTGFGTLTGFAVAPASAVPLPATLPLLLGGLAGFAALRRRRKAHG